MSKRKDYGQAVDMYGAGFSIPETAKAFGVNTGRMRRILKNRGVVLRPRATNSESHFFRHGLPVTKEQTHANNTVKQALRDRHLVAQPCECCGTEGFYANGRRKVQAHHDDYAAPLDVRWLCKSCHYMWHTTNGAGNRSGLQETKA